MHPPRRAPHETRRSHPGAGVETEAPKARRWAILTEPGWSVKTRNEDTRAAGVEDSDGQRACTQAVHRQRVVSRQAEVAARSVDVARITMTFAPTVPPDGGRRGQSPLLSCCG